LHAWLRGWRLRVRRGRLRAFAAALADVYAVRDGWTSWLSDETIICRCEEVPHARLLAAINDLGATDPRTAKLFSRAGMGRCQGRICGYPVSRITSMILGEPTDKADLERQASRPLAQPIRLGDLADAPEIGLEIDSEDSTSIGRPRPGADDAQ
jgi:hypothetical protein